MGVGIETIFDIVENNDEDDCHETDPLSETSI